METLNNFRHKTLEHVRYNDLDTLGHVNNARYLNYLEEARIGYFETVMGFDKRTLDFQAVVGSVNIRYLQPVNYGDAVELYTRCSRIGEKSIDFQTLIVKRSPKAPDVPVLAAESTVTLVSYDVETQRAVAHRPETVARIRAYEPGTL